MTDYNMDNEPMDLVKCLYKLHFQLLLLLESFGKLLRLISHGNNQNLASDKSRELALIQIELRKAFKTVVVTEVTESGNEDTEVTGTGNEETEVSGNENQEEASNELQVCQFCNFQIKARLRIFQSSAIFNLNQVFVDI